MSMVSPALMNVATINYVVYIRVRAAVFTVDMSSFLKAAKPEILTLAGIKYSGFNVAGALKCHIDHGQEFNIS